MAHSEICPVCLGNGKVGKPEYGYQLLDTCHGCNGKGWVEVQDSGFPFIPCDPPAPVCPWPPQPYVPDPWIWTSPPNTWENDNQVTQKDFPQYVYVGVIDSGGSLNRF